MCVPCRGAVFLFAVTAVRARANDARAPHVAAGLHVANQQVQRLRVVFIVFTAVGPDLFEPEVFAKYLVSYAVDDVFQLGSQRRHDFKIFVEAGGGVGTILRCGL